MEDVVFFCVAFLTPLYQTCDIPIATYIAWLGGTRKNKRSIMDLFCVFGAIN